MLGSLVETPEFWMSPTPSRCQNHLSNSVSQGFKEVDGCVVPNSFQQSAVWFDARPKTIGNDDETALECSESTVSR